MMANHPGMQDRLPVFLRRQVLHFETAIEEAVRAFAASLPGQACLLDAGAGECQYKRWFSRQRYTGVDLAVGDASWNYGGLDALANLTALPFRDGAFDACINVVTLEQPGPDMFWSPVARWVNRPVNFSRAQAVGLEMEIRGRAGELMPAWFDPKLPLNLRAALNLYHSRVDAVMGPNNRLDSQQPWSANLGFDYRTAHLPMNLGASFAYTPGYLTQQTDAQATDISRTRSLDLFAQYFLSKTSSLRVSANNFVPVDTQSDVITRDGSTFTNRKARTQFGLTWETKL